MMPSSRLAHSMAMALPKTGTANLLNNPSSAQRHILTLLHQSASSPTSSTMMMMTHPTVWSTGLKRQHLTLQSMTQNQQIQTQRLKDFVHRLRRNLNRLRGRRLVEMALAALAAQQFKTQMEQMIDQPSNWQNWSKREWADELMAQVGTSKVQRFGKALWRIGQLTALATPCAIMAPLSYFSNTIHEYNWAYALWAIEHAGPTAIKWVQWATTRQDLFSPEFCNYFGKLRDETRGHAWKDTLEILEQDLGPLANALDLEQEPIGSGCIAQVYRGKLLESTGQFPKGTELAIKVQHPDIWNKVCVDFYLLGKVASFLESIPTLDLKYLALTDTVRQFRDIMLPQLDLSLEAKHLNRFNRDFGYTDRINFPQPLEALTAKRVLTETFLPGKPILQYTKAPEHKRRELAHLGVDLTLRMIFLNDFLHGDLHPGNILVHESDSGKLSINLLDCGLVVEMGPDTHVNLTKIMAAFSRRDGALAARLMIDSSSDCQAEGEDVDYFIQGISRICNENSNFIEHVGDKITDICYLACRHQVKLEAAFISCALAIEIIEGVAKTLYHDIPVASPALKYIVQAEVMHNLPKMNFW